MKTYLMLSETGSRSLKATKQESLNPALWSRNTLKPGVQDGIRQLTKRFLSELDLSTKDLADIRIVGSQASPFYHPKRSDLDIQVVLNDNSEITRKRFKLLSRLASATNALKNYTLNGIDTNFYTVLRGLNNPQIQGQGVFSLNDGWISKPAKEQRWDPKFVSTKANELLNQIDSACDSGDLKCLKNEWKRIKRLRGEALRESGEQGLESMVIRELKRSGRWKKLQEHIQHLDKLHNQVVTTGEFPPRPMEDLQQERVRYYNFDSMIKLLNSVTVTNEDLWHDCFNWASKRFHSDSRDMQLLEATDIYGRSGGMFLRNGKRLTPRVDISQARQVNESTSLNSRAMSNVLSSTANTILRQSSSRAVRGLMKECSHHPMHTKVALTSEIMVSKRPQVLESCGCESCSHEWYPTMLNNLYEQNSDSLLDVDMLDLMKDIVRLVGEQ